MLMLTWDLIMVALYINTSTTMQYLFPLLFHVKVRCGLEHQFYGLNGSRVADIGLIIVSNQCILSGLLHVLRYLLCGVRHFAFQVRNLPPNQRNKCALNRIRGNFLN